MAHPLWKKIVDNVPDDAIRRVGKTFDIVDRIHQLREARNWSQKDLAEKLGKKPSEVSKWLTPGHNFTVKTIAKLESVFEADILLTPARHEARNMEIHFPQRDKDDLYDQCLGHDETNEILRTEGGVFSAEDFQSQIGYAFGGSVKINLENYSIPRLSKGNSKKGGRTSSYTMGA